VCRLDDVTNRLERVVVAMIPVNVPDVLEGFVCGYVVFAGEAIPVPVAIM